MGYIIEISEHKMHKATDYAEKMLKYGGMLMQCLTEWSEESGFGERRDYYGNRYENMGQRRETRGSYGSRGGSMGYRDEDDDDDYEYMGQRRRRGSMGRYR